MTNIHIEGFDYQESENVVIESGTALNTGGVYSFASGRYGRGRAIEFNSTTDFATITTNSGNEIFAGAAFYINTNSLNFISDYGHRIMSFSETSEGYNDPHVVFHLSPTNGFIVTRDTADAVLGKTANGLIKARRWNYLEVRIVVSTTVGIVEAYLNGVQVLNLTGLDNKEGSAATTNIDFVYLDSNPSMPVQWDNVYVNDTGGSSPFNGNLGETEIVTLRPDGDGFQNDFTATGTGITNADRVDDSIGPDDDTTYVESATINDIDSYTVENLPYTADNVDALQLCARVKSDDGGAKTARQRLRSSASDHLGSNFAVQSTYTGNRELVLQDPNTTSAWTSGGVNAMEIGHEVIA